jgi:predicted TPR repeat methyltransferase
MQDLSPEEQETLETYNTCAREWDAKHDTFGFWQEEMDLFQSFMPSGSLLEIGCGAGRDAVELIERGYTYHGTDISEELIKIAQGKNPDAQFDQVSLYDLKKLNKQYDGFWCSAVLLHIPFERLEEAFEAIGFCLQEGAVGFISIKEGEGSGYLSSEKQGGEHKRHFYYHSQEGFSQVLQVYGFEVLECIYKPMSEKTRWLSYFVRKT